MSIPHPDQRTLKVFKDAAELSREQREEFVSQACGGDEALRASVESLLAELGSCPSDYLEPPPGFEEITGDIVRRFD